MEVIAYYNNPPQGQTAYMAGPVHATDLVKSTDIHKIISDVELMQAIAQDPDGRYVIEVMDMTVAKKFDATLVIDICGHQTGEMPVNLAMMLLLMGKYVGSQNNLIYLMTRHRAVLVNEDPRVVIARASNVGEEPYDATDELYP